MSAFNLFTNEYIPLYGYVSFAHQSSDIWVASTFWPLWIMLLWTLLQLSDVHQFSFLFSCCKMEYAIKYHMLFTLVENRTQGQYLRLKHVYPMCFRGLSWGRLPLWLLQGEGIRQTANGKQPSQLLFILQQQNTDCETPSWTLIHKENTFQQSSVRNSRTAAEAGLPWHFCWMV